MTKKGVLLLICLIVSIVALENEALAQKAAPAPIKIVIDPGHGGRDPGAIGVNGLFEKVVNLDISHRLRDLLVAQGFDVVMTREDDRLLVDYGSSGDKQKDLQARVDVATRERADLFISIHANSYPYKKEPQGTMVLYFDPGNYDSSYKPTWQMEKWSAESKRLAYTVLSSITSRVGTKNLGVVPRNVYVVRMGTVPSILVETAFLSNPEDAANLADPGFRQQVAEAIASAVAAYHPYRYVDIVDHWAKEEISQLSLNGIVQGYNDGTFKPENGLTRAELVALVDRATGFEGAPSTQPNTTFTDVERGFWGYQSVITAAEKGIVKGFPDGSFRPNDPVTREEFAAIIYRLINPGKDITPPSGSVQTQNSPSVSDAVYQEEKLGATTDKQSAIASKPEPGKQTASAVSNMADEKSAASVVISSLAFTDIPESSWAKAAIYSLYESGLLNGIKEGFFGYGVQVKRAEAATLLYRMLEYTKK